VDLLLRSGTTYMVLGSSLEQLLWGHACDCIWRCGGQCLFVNSSGDPVQYSIVLQIKPLYFPLSERIIQALSPIWQYHTYLLTA
jgi:hypothetical protein